MEVRLGGVVGTAFRITFTMFWMPPADVQPLRHRRCRRTTITLATLVSSGPGAGAPAAIMYAIPMEEEEEEVDGAYAVPATQYGVDSGAFC